MYPLIPWELLCGSQGIRRENVISTMESRIRIQKRGNNLLEKKFEEVCGKSLL
jgi:hypothetical protein